ncbi:MAG: cadherin-like domain-containing protein [Ardenticatenaceae bacterium]|nr:cadherin-like domain-containing protein [Ardenticatenaceae bacterium]
MQYYPHNTYLVWGSQTQALEAATLTSVRWHGLFHPAYKVDNYLRTFTGTIHNVDIMFYNDGNINATLAAIESLGGTILQYYPAQPDKAFYDAVVQLDVAQLDSVAQLNTVLWLGHLSPEPILDDEMSSQILAGNHPGNVPVVGYNAYLADLGYDGTGVTWAIVDTGVDYDHPDLNTHIIGGYEFPGSCNTGNPGDDCAGGGHGTHVAGIVGGTGVGDSGGPYTDPNGFLYGLGVAPGYSIFAMNSLSAPSWPPAGGWQEHSKRAVLGGAIGGNNSWTTGEGTNHGYQASERTHDIMVRDGNFDTTTIAEPFIEVFSAGNSGPGTSTLTAPKEGKNLIITASSRNFRAGDIDLISSFSSRGPAVDGRWVPTITSPGESIASTRNDEGGSCGTAIAGTNGLYSLCSGTSMAAPHTSGAIVLTTEWWRTFNSGADPSPAMAKALVVNGSVDMGTADIPNINEGWGRVNVTNIISPSVPAVYYDQTTTFGSTGDQWAISVGVIDPSKPLRITLAWSDAPGAVGANPALVNNLDLTVESNGNTYLGNVFSSGWSATGGTADTLNNLENVFIQNPGGNAIITIDATNISGDGVPYNADITDQDFALVCSNCSLGQDFSLSATPNTQTVCAPANALYNVNIGSNLGFNDVVSLSASGQPNPPNSAVFSDNNQPAPYTSTLTIGTNGASSGNYSIQIVGIAPTSTHTTTVQLNVETGAPGATPLVAPADGATGVSTTPTFEWTAVTGTSSYYLEVATDSAFNTIVYTATINAPNTSHVAGMTLNTDTVYYWRITGTNACGGGTASSVFSFSTGSIYCNTPALGIPDNSPTGISNDMVIGGSGSITDLDISLDVSHTWVGDLIFTLEHVDTGTTATFYDRPGYTGSGFGCSSDNVDVTANDEGPDGDIESQCDTNPAISGNRVGGDPANSSLLAAFDGESLSGTWRLTASDNAGGDTGTINEWCIIPAAQAVAPAIEVAPSSLSSDQATNTQVTQTLTISNVGDADLDWEIFEEAATFNSRVGADAVFLPGLVAGAAEAQERADTAVSVPAAPTTSGSAAILSAPTALLYDNGPLVNSPGTGVGGADEAVLQTTSLGLNTLGFGHQLALGYRIADDFTIPPGETWTLDTITFYAYQTGSTTTSTMNGITLQIWDGQPGAGGAVIWGDDTTNVLVNTGWANVYRVTETTTGTAIDRPIMASVAAVGGLSLPAGTYWLAWNTGGTLASGPWAPPININGQANTGNGLQTLDGGTTWAAALDTGAGTPQQGFPFLIEGSSGCAATDLPWVTASPLSGTIGAGNATDVAVMFDSTGYAAGVYTGTLCVNSNDPLSPQVRVPLTMTVLPNAVPVAADDAYTTTQDVTLTVSAPGVLGNDTDGDGDSLTAVLDTDVTSGTLALNADGSFTYTPTAGFEGTATFTYQANDGLDSSNVATVTITVVNTAPVAVADSYTTTEGITLTVSAPGVLDNDSDGDGDGLTAVLDTTTSNGTLTLNTDGSFTYVPDAGFAGTDSFTYHANDGTDDSEVVTVTITVTMAEVEGYVIYLPFVTKN